MPQHETSTPEDEELAIEQELNERLLARQDYHTFIRRLAEPRFKGGFKDGWHIGVIAKIAHQIKYALDHPEDEEAPRTYVVTMPPRCMKSENFARGIPLWNLAHNPKVEIIVGTCEGSLAKEHGDWIKETATSDPYFTTLFPEFEVRQDSRAKDRLLTSKGGGVRSVGRGGGAVGRGADLFIIDDPYKNDKEADSPAIQKEVWDWYINVADSRLSPGGVMVIMHTRWRTDDLIGRVLKMHQDSEIDIGRVCHIDFPLIADHDEFDPFDPKRLLRRAGDPLHPARFDKRWAERKKAKMYMAGASGRRTWNAIYQQNPVVEEGNFFQRKALLKQLYNPADLPKDLFYYLPTDYAVTENEDNDPTVLWPFGVDRNGNFWFLPEFYRDWEQIDVTIPKTVDIADRYKVMSILIEKGVILQAIEPQLKKEMEARKAWSTLTAVPLGRHDKKLRARAARAMVEQGKMFFPDTRWFYDEVLTELLAFPNGEHDDIVDNLSLAANAVADIDAPFGGPDLPEIDEDDPFAGPEPEKKEETGGKYDLRHPDRWS